ncbi:hypothetical protein GGX14DRAFT_400146 [Mycena pura]|uniref:Uncharacterized protein n=1 Tax=Mycena pura TaxID=153505 RepID=A0AAD6V2L8_9AGAR|nr:hypothetical protein GGX14DRAFT_400146 [Mycena pura]
MPEEPRLAHVVERGGTLCPRCSAAQQRDIALRAQQLGGSRGGSANIQMHQPGVEPGHQLSTAVLVPKRTTMRVRLDGAVVPSVPVGLCSGRVKAAQGAASLNRTRGRLHQRTTPPRKSHFQQIPEEPHNASRVDVDTVHSIPMLSSAEQSGERAACLEERAHVRLADSARPKVTYRAVPPSRFRGLRGRERRRWTPRAGAGRPVVPKAGGTPHAMLGGGGGSQEGASVRLWRPAARRGIRKGKFWAVGTCPAARPLWSVTTKAVYTHEDFIVHFLSKTSGRNFVSGCGWLTVGATQDGLRPIRPGIPGRDGRGTGGASAGGGRSAPRDMTSRDGGRFAEMAGATQDSRRRSLREKWMVGRHAVASRKMEPRCQEDLFRARELVHSHTKLYGYMILNTFTFLIGLHGRSETREICGDDCRFVLTDSFSTHISSRTAATYCPAQSVHGHLFFLTPLAAAASRHPMPAGARRALVQRIAVTYHPAHIPISVRGRLSRRRPPGHRLVHVRPEGRALPVGLLDSAAKIYWAMAMHNVDASTSAPSAHPRFDAAGRTLMGSFHATWRLLTPHAPAARTLPTAIALPRTTAAYRPAHAPMSVCGLALDAPCHLPTIVSTVRRTLPMSVRLAHVCPSLELTCKPGCLFTLIEKSERTSTYCAGSAFD